ncbi:hypothetical protein AAVH_12016 [Aphelenchoides avenae]|nr:hypothetical protein AAVH_12016 [Aphelenchus avenae]
MRGCDLPLCAGTFVAHLLCRGGNYTCCEDELCNAPSNRIIDERDPTIMLSTATKHLGQLCGDLPMTLSTPKRHQDQTGGLAITLLKLKRHLDQLLFSLKMFSCTTWKVLRKLKTLSLVLTTARSSRTNEERLFSMCNNDSACVIVDECIDHSSLGTRQNGAEDNGIHTFANSDSGVNKLDIDRFLHQHFIIMPAGHPPGYCDDCETLTSEETAATGCETCKERVKGRLYQRKCRLRKKQKQQATTSSVTDEEEEEADSVMDIDLEAMREHAMLIVDQVSSQLCHCEGCSVQLSVLKAQLGGLFAASTTPADVAAPPTFQNPEGSLLRPFCGHHMDIHRSDFDAALANVSIDYLAVNVVDETPGLTDSMMEVSVVQTSAESEDQSGFAAQLAPGSFGSYVPSSNNCFVHAASAEYAKSGEPTLTTLETVRANASALATDISSAAFSTSIYALSVCTSLLLSPTDAIRRDDLFPINYYLGKQLRIIELLHKYAEALYALEERGICIRYVGPANFRFELGQCAEPERYTGFQTKITILDVDESQQNAGNLAPEILNGHGARYKSASFSLFKMFYDVLDGEYHFVEEAVIVKGRKRENAWRRVNPFVTRVLQGALSTSSKHRLGLRAFLDLFWRTSEGIADDGLICVRSYEPQWSSPDDVSWFD